MAKHRRSTRKGRDKQSHASSDPRQRGLQAFRAGRLDEAINRWSQLAHQDAQVAAALAEAHFRRALMQPPGDEQVEDLRRAVSQAPHELRYRYHLGLALHCAGDLAEAVQCYRAVLQRDSHWAGAGSMLALAALEQDPQTDLAALPGSTSEVREVLAPVQALLCGEMPQPGGQEPVAQLWYGLGLLQDGDASAREILDDPRTLPSKQAAAVRRYYQGVAAAQGGDREAALASWQELYDQDRRTPWLVQNVAAILPSRLREQCDAGDLECAVATIRRWLPLAAGSPALAGAFVQTLDRAAHAAAVTGDWTRAADLWEEARQIVSSGSGLGSPRLLLHNLALAHEAKERWMEAAETWRAMLRTRPRGTARKAAEGSAETAASRSGNTAPAPGVLSEEQWSWVRRRVIECYRRAGTPGEAVAIFRQAIKADPEDLDLRLELAEALLANEQEQAAINELQRILTIAPQHIEARLRLAQAHMAGGYWHAAEQTLREVLRQHPDHAGAQRQMVELLHEHGMDLLESGFSRAAAPLFEEGQRLAPDDYRFPLNLARIAVTDRKRKRAKSLLEQVLTLGSERSFAYVQVIECWAVLGDMDEARAVLRQAEAALRLTSDFYVGVGLLLLRRTGQPPPLALFAPAPSPPADTPWSRWAEELLDHAVELDPGDPDVCTQIALDLLKIRPDLMPRYAEEAVRRAPDDARSLMMLGLAHALNHQEREAKDTLRRGANLARRQGDMELAADIDSLRQQVGSPFLSLALSMGSLLDDVDLDDDPFL